MVLLVCFDQALGHRIPVKQTYIALFVLKTRKTSGGIAPSWVAGLVGQAVINHNVLLAILSSQFAE